MTDMKNNKEFLEICEENHISPDGGVQWQAIFEDNNVVVSAGAGSGKTTVLSFRFLRIVAEQKATPDRILTITFTKKATAEMKSRIYQLLSCGLKKGIVSENDMNLFSKVTISTVDSFCSEIVRSDSVHQGVPSDFSIQGDNELQVLSDSIAREVLSSVSDAEFRDKLYKFFSVENLLQIFHDLAGSYLNIAKPVNKAQCIDELKNHIKCSVRKTMASYEDNIRYYLDKYGNEDPVYERIRLLNLALEYIGSSDSLLCLKVSDLLESDAFSLSSMKGLDPDAKDILKVIRKFSNKTCQERQDMVVYANAILDMDFMENFYDIVIEFERKLYDAKRSLGVLGFRDVMQLAIRILSQNRRIRDKFKSRFRYIMIDEFQDNNDDYRKLLYLLSEKEYGENENPVCDDEGIPVLESLCKDKIFLVGDEKQSIYKFRGADVRVFKRLSSEICSAPLELKKNWRSEPKIIDFCNRVFPVIMQEPGKGHVDFEADYIPLEKRPAAVPECHIAFIHSEQPSEDDKTDEAEREAHAVAKFIEEICSPSSTYLVPDDKTKALRPPRYDEIGLLLKVGTRQSCYEKAMRLRGIPYSVTESKSLFSEALACDFYCALQCCVYPYDEVAKAAYLKSPFCGLNDRQLRDYLQSDGNCGSEIADRVSSALKRIEDLKEILTSGSIAAAVEYMWFVMGYRSFIISKQNNQPYSEHYDYMHALAVKYDATGQSVVRMLDYMRPMIDSGSTKLDELTVFSEQNEGVKVMTIHKSKGLAFKVVIVADIQAAGSPGGFRSNITENGKGIFLPYAADAEGSARNPFVISMKDLETKLENAETKRIYYVAATRAKHHLVFSGIMKEDKIPEVDENKSNTMMAYFLKSIGYTEDGPSEDVPIEEITVSPDSSEKVLPQLSSDDFAAAAGKCETLSFSAGPETVAVTEAAAASGDGFNENGRKLRALRCDSIIDSHNLSKEFGTLVHKMLELSFDNQQYDFSGMLSSDIDENEKSLVLDCARELRDGFFGSSLYKMISSGFALNAEKKVLLQYDGRILKGTIDLLAVSDKQAIIIDYKTDAFTQEHEAQLGFYKAAVASVYPGLEVKAYVCYLREPEAFLEV